MTAVMPRPRSKSRSSQVSSGPGARSRAFRRTVRLRAKMHRPIARRPSRV